MCDALLDAFSEWTAKFETASWTADSLVVPDSLEGGHLVEPKMILDWPEFLTRGLALAKRLKEEVGALFRVVYEIPGEDPAHHDSERREVLDGGSVIPLPHLPMPTVYL